MKNRNLQFKATALLIPLLACFAMFFFATIPAAAGAPITFNGTVSGKIPADMGPPVVGSNGCVFNFYVTNTGSATELGEFTGASNFIPNVCTGSYTGTFLWIAADGASISGTFAGQLIPTATQGVFDNNETATITGGTGRFIGATGATTHGGQVNFVTSSFVLPFTGTINLANPLVANLSGTVSGKIPADMGPPVAGSNGCVFNFYVTNTGSATELGEFTGASNFIPNVCTGSYTGTFLWIGADGASIFGTFAGQLIPTATQGLFDNSETATITGGTGRFVGATGTITLGGQVNFATASFILPFQGTTSLESAKLANVSARGVVGSRDDVMITGFILGGGSSTNVIIRALGPSLGGAGVQGVLADPTLDLRDANGVRVAFNNDWQENSAQAALINATGIPPQNPREAAIVATLGPGQHTAIVSGKDGGTGVALVEVYSLQ
jgi:hypothetical protein